MPSLQLPSRLRAHFVPLAACVLAALAISFAPVIVWRLKIGYWLFVLDEDTLYYLQIVARSYYSYFWRVTDPAVLGGTSLYPWLQIVPATGIAIVLGTGPFSVDLIWHLWAAVGMGAGSYALFWRFVRQRWGAAACAVLVVSDAGLGKARFAYAQVSLLWKVLRWWAGSALDIFPPPFTQYRLLNPALDFPFLFLQVAAVATAREQPSRLKLWASATAFAFLFYLYFYAWTMAAAGLVVAFVVDRVGRRVYAQTLLLGFALALPQLIADLITEWQVSSIAMRRVGYVIVSPTNIPQAGIPWLGGLILIVTAIAIWRLKRQDLAYLWSLATAGLLLSRSRIVTGIWVQDFHWDWLWLPLVCVTLLILIVALLRSLLAGMPWAAWTCAVITSGYLIAGVYLATTAIPRRMTAIRMRNNYQKYTAQRLARDVKPLASASTIAGTEDFCDLAAIGENQLALAGTALDVSVDVDDSELSARLALNAFLSGEDQNAFQTRLASERWWYWHDPGSRRLLIDKLTREYDAVARDPVPFMDRFAVRYVALPITQSPPAYLDPNWSVLQKGPYWNIWERVHAEPVKKKP